MPQIARLGLFEMMEAVPDEESAETYIEARRWPNGVACPRCGSLDTRRVKSAKPMAHHCPDCRRYFSVRTGTVMERSMIPLRKWVLAIYLLHTSRKSVSSHEMARLLKVTVKSAWFLNHRIREAMKHDGGKLSGVVESDETFIGGLDKFKHAHKKLGWDWASGRQVVLGFYERETGRVIAFPVGSTMRYAIRQRLLEHVEEGSILFTDRASSYERIPEFMQSSVNHGKGEYVRGNVHTNSIESFWSRVKRIYRGTHHQYSFKHLHRYVNEAAHMQSVRGRGGTMERMDATIEGMEGRRLTYEALTEEAA